MTRRKAAFYIVWSLLTQTTNWSFRGFVVTLAGDWQGFSLQISLLPRTEQRTPQPVTEALLTDPQHFFQTRVLAQKLSGCFVWLVLFGVFLFVFPYWVRGATLKKLQTAAFRAKVFDSLCWVPSDVLPSPAHHPTFQLKVTPGCELPLTHPHLLVCCGCEDPPVRFSLCVDWSIVISSALPPLLGIWTGRGQYRKALKKTKDCRGCPWNPHISCCCCPR